MNKHWFNRLLLSYLPMFFIIASFLILITFLLINQFAQVEAKKANEVYVRHVMQMIDSTLKPLDQMIVNGLQSDEKLLNYFKSDHDNAFMAEFEVSNRLKELSNTSSLIDSIYLYKYEDEHVLTHNFKVPLEQFGDRAFVRAMAEGAYTPIGWSEKRDYAKFKDQDSFTEVISLVRRVPLLSGEQGLIVLNVRLDGIRAFISDMSDSTLSYLNLLDQNGSMMLIGADNGSLLHSDKRSNKELTTVQSEYTGWVIHSGIRSKPFFDFVSVFSYAWIIVQLAIVVLGIVWIVYVTRRNYKPIELIMNSIHHYFEKKSHLFVKRGRLDEFAFIETALEKLMLQSSDSDIDQEDHMRMKRRQWFQELADENLLADPRKLYDYDPSDCGLIFLVEIDQYSLFKEKYGSSDQNLLKYVLRSVVEESAEAQRIPIWTEWISASRLAVLCHLEEISTETQAHMASFCEPIRLWVEQHLDMTVTIGVGRLAETKADLPLSYAEANDALKLKLTQGGNRVITQEQSWTNRAPHEAIHGLVAIHTIAQYFRAGDKQWKEKLEELFLDLKNGAFSYEEIHHVIHYLIYHLHGEMSGLPEEHRRLWRREIFPRLKEGAEALDTLELLQACLDNELSTMADHLLELRQSNNHMSLMLDIQAYINEHYPKPELSLAFLSEQFEINPNYLSRLFKECVGENFVDYLIRIRMERAKVLLEEKEDSVQQIAEQVGYTHAVSFIRIFKRTVGVTPGDYRKKTAS